MCGIAGSVNCILTREDIELIRHRGPDFQDLKQFNIGQSEIFLGHTRLSILDLTEAGNQPMISQDGHYAIVFNGEIYNHQELRKRITGVTFKSTCDTETILYYIIQNGINAIKDFNGIFAFAFLDMRSGLIYLSRDKFGVKPLYYLFNQNQVIFSSEIRLIRNIIKCNISNETVYSSFRMRYTPSPFTVYKNIEKVEPGQILIFKIEDEIKHKKEYFQHQSERTETGRKDNFKRLVIQYGDLFEKAVERQLMSDVEIGVLLSGGVDSALVAAIMQKNSKTPVKAFTIGFEDRFNDIDEINLAQDSASVLKLDHYYTRIGFIDLLNTIKKIANIVEEPVATTSIIPMYFLSELAASKVKVVLSGQGADEPLGGYNKYKALPYLEIFRRFRPVFGILKYLQPQYQNHENLRRVLSSLQYEDILDAYIEFNSIAPLNQVINLARSSDKERIKQFLLSQKTYFRNILVQKVPKNISLSNLFLYLDMRTSLADDLLMYTDKITMNFGLECRVPILDNDLIAFIESLSRRYKFNTRKGKIIHKAFAKEYLPASIIDRKKLGFKSPTEFWFRQNAEQLSEIFEKDKSFCQLFDHNKIKELINQHQKGKNLEKQIFYLLIIRELLN